MRKIKVGRQRVLPFNGNDEEGGKKGKRKGGVIKAAADKVGSLFNGKDTKK